MDQRRALATTFDGEFSGITNRNVEDFILIDRHTCADAASEAELHGAVRIVIWPVKISAG
jgi:hypothetical protein